MVIKLHFPELHLKDLSWRKGAGDSTRKVTPLMPDTSPAAVLFLHSKNKREMWLYSGLDTLCNKQWKGRKGSGKALRLGLLLLKRIALILSLRLRADISLFQFFFPNSFFRLRLIKDSKQRGRSPYSPILYNFTRFLAFSSIYFVNWYTKDFRSNVWIILS